MKRGSIKSEIKDNGKITIRIDLVDGTVWMSKSELAELFMVYLNTISTNLRALFNSGILREEDVTKEYRYTHNKQERIAVYYNLEVIIALCYRIDSPAANALRKQIIKNIVDHATGDKEGKNHFYLFSLNLN